MRDLRLSWLWWTLGIGMVATVWVLSLTPRPPSLGFENGDKLGHFLAYGAQVAWFGWMVSRRWVWRVVLLFVLQGALLEVLQGLSGYRQPDLYDMFANSIGAGIGWVVVALFGSLLVSLESRLPGRSDAARSIAG